MSLTHEEYRGYCHDMVRLQLWFLCAWLKRHPAENFQSALRLHVGIGRFLEFWPADDNAQSAFLHADWVRLEQAASEKYQSLGGDPDRFEQAAFPLFQPSIDRRAAVDYLKEIDFSGFQCGSLRYAAPVAADPQCTVVHIANRLRPRSIFDDPAYLPDCLRQVMEMSGREYGATSMSVASWLNSHPLWLALFPEEWTQSLSPIDDDSGRWYGHWGQFINARGLFNRKLGRLMRQTGHFPYPRRTAQCTFDTLRRHLATLNLDADKLRPGRI